MSEYEYMQVRMGVQPGGTAEVARAANNYAQQGWRLVTTVPVIRHRNHESEMIDLVLERVKRENDESEWNAFSKLMERMGNKEMMHNHPSGAVCGESCPILIAWNKIGEQR